MSRDLSALTGRSAGLSLPPLPSATPTAPPATRPAEPSIVEQEPPAAVTPATAPVIKTRQPSKKTAPAPTPAPTDTTPSDNRRRIPIPIYMPQSLRERLDAALRDASYNDFILDAFDAQYDSLAEAFPALPARRVLPERGRARRRNLGPMVTLQIRPMEQELHVIDARAAELHTSSRSELLCKAIELQLEGDQL